MKPCRVTNTERELSRDAKREMGIAEYWDEREGDVFWNWKTPPELGGQNVFEVRHLQPFSSLGSASHTSTSDCLLLIGAYCSANAP